MFAKLIASLLLLAIMLQMLNRALVYVDYYTNTAAYFAKCENKGRPAMRCNGKCQVMKKLAENEKEEQQHPERRMGFDELINAPMPVTSHTIQYHILAYTYQLQNDRRTVAMPRSCFHPPGA